MALFDFLSGEFIDVIEWTDDTRDTMVWRFERRGNAIKYGALATPGARIEMTCRFDQRGTFHLDWHETMPKAPAPAGRSGFGTLLLTEVIARQLEAEVSHDLTDQGLRYAIRFVLSDGR